MSGPERWLLPEGIEEVLPDEARQLEAMRRLVLDLFVSWGYEPVMPPLVEYLDALLTGVGKELDLQTFKLTDQVSGRMMGARADITPQAARIDAHYLKRKGPARLCYIGPALRTRPDEFAGSREPLQMGAELFGHSGPASDAEVLRLMIVTLTSIGIEKLHIDLGNVAVFRGLADAAGIAGEQEAQLFEAMQRKAEVEVTQMLSSWNVDGQLAAMLTSLIELNGGGETLELARERLRGAPKSVITALDDLANVAQLVEREFPQSDLNYDLAELSGYGYHTGIVFSVFVPGHGKALANGGRYDGIGEAFGRVRSATGFSADLRELMRLTSATRTGLTGIMAPDVDDESLRKLIAELRAAGERVVQLLPGQEVIPEELGCDREIVKQKDKWGVKAR
jgi:ATP phosphoribosyltransferase regulatory subunit